MNRFLCNENFPIASIRLLREAGVDAVAVSETQAGAKDSIVLRTAAAEDRVIVTFDRDYGELIFRQGLASPAGVLYLRFEPQTPTEPGELLLRLLGVPGLQFHGMFSVVNRREIRQRPLPEH